MKLATVFSGIGAIEQSLLRLGIDHEIVFACDNGDVELNLLSEKDLEDYTRLTKLRSKKQLSDPAEIKRLEELGVKENLIAEGIRTQISSMRSKIEKKQFVDALYANNSRQNNFVKKAYIANYGDKLSENDFHLDIRFLDGRDYKKDKIDLLVGGSPCQAFSAVGAKYGLNDTRGTLFYEFARIVKETQPRVFIYENVRGLTTHDDGHTWEVMRSVFENDLNYRIAEPQVVNASDYGIPQSRERIYCIGFKNETEFKYPAPIKLDKTVYDFLQNRFDKKYLLKQKGVHFITRAINYQKSYTQVNGNIILCQKRNQQFNWHGDFVYHPKLKEDTSTPETDPNLFKVADFEEDYYLQNNPAKYAIKRAGDEEMMFKASDKEIDPSYGRFRKLTPRECLRLMGFDDTFNIVVSDTETYKQAGNSIVVNVLMALLRKIDITKYGTDI